VGFHKVNSSFSYRQLFDTVAPHYEARIIRAFGPYAESLIEWANPQPHEIVLDMGTGTGIVARLIAPLVQQIIGLDFSALMLQTAKKISPPPTTFIQGDAHTLPLANKSVDMVIASFGFNATKPKRSLKESSRVLKPGGRLVLQEWGGLHEIDRIVGEVISTYVIEDEVAPSELIAIRDFLDEDNVWNLQTDEDYQESLAELGFEKIEASEHRPIKLRLPVEEFIDYKTAWTSQKAEIAAMPSATQRAYLAQLENRLYQQADEDGILTYDPLIFRVMAYRPTMD
jgi:SAM-dependent methyltransferase